MAFDIVYISINRDVGLSSLSYKSGRIDDTHCSIITKRSLNIQ